MSGSDKTKSCWHWQLLPMLLGMALFLALVYVGWAEEFFATLGWLFLILVLVRAGRS